MDSTGVSTTSQVADGVDSSDLASLDDAYHNAADENGGVPDGKYTVTVERVELKRSQRSNAKMLEWELKVVGPELVGRKMWKYTLLETPDHMTFAKRDFRACGLDLEKLSELPSRLNELLDVTVEVTVKTKNDFQGIYFRRLVEEGGTSRGDGGGDVPF